MKKGVRIGGVILLALLTCVVFVVMLKGTNACIKQLGTGKCVDPTPAPTPPPTPAPSQCIKQLGTGKCADLGGSSGSGGSGDGQWTLKGCCVIEADQECKDEKYPDQSTCTQIYNGYVSQCRAAAASYGAPGYQVTGGCTYDGDVPTQQTQQQDQQQTDQQTADQAAQEQQCLDSCATFYVCSWENGKCIKRIAPNQDNNQQDTQTTTTDTQNNGAGQDNQQSNPQDSQQNQINGEPSNAQHVSASQGNAQESEIYSQIHSAIAAKQSQVADKVADYVKDYQAQINAEANEAVSFDLPQGSPVQSVVAVANEKLTDATMTVTTIDEVNLEKAVPVLGGKGVIGNPDYPVPILPLAAPSSNAYDIQYLLKVENKMPTDSGSTPYYKEAFFNFVLGGTEADAKNTKLLHYDESTNQWVPLPTQYYTTKDVYGRYVFSAHTPSFSYFAIVREKSIPFPSSVFIGVIVVIILVEAVVVGFVRKRLLKKASLGKKSKSKSNGTTSLVLGILGLVLVLIPYVAFVLSLLAIVFAQAQKLIKPTKSANTGYILGIVGACLNALILIFVVLAFAAMH